MTLDEAIAALEAGLSNRHVDECLHDAASTMRFRPKPRDARDAVPDHVPRYTSDTGLALNHVLRIAPYASYRLAFDSDRNVHTFDICGQRGLGALAAIAICQGLLKHMRQRVAPNPHGDRYRQVVDRVNRETDVVIAGVMRAGYGGKPLPSIDEPPSQKVMMNETAVQQAIRHAGSIKITTDPVNFNLRVEIGNQSWGLSPLAVEAVLRLKGAKYLSPDADDDAWCSAIAMADLAPRDVLAELPQIREAVKALRG